MDGWRQMLRVSASRVSVGNLLMNWLTSIAPRLRYDVALLYLKNAEWDLLDRAEAEDGEERFDTNSNRGNAVVVKDIPLDGGQFDESRRVKVDGKAGDTTHNGPNGIRMKGTSGWTKIRNREEPP